MKRVCVALMLASGAAHAQEAAPVEKLRDVEERHSRVAHWMRQLEQEQGDVLAVLEAVEKMAATAQARMDAAEDDAQKVQDRLDAAVEEEARLEDKRQAMARHLGPRLALRYRLAGAGDFKAMLSLSDGSIGTFLWRRRMVDRILADDLVLVEALALQAKEAAAARKRIDLEKEALREAQTAVRHQAAEAMQRRVEHAAVLAELETKHGAYARMASQLERARGALLEDIANLPPTPEGLGGFGSRRGALEWPAHGEVELGFGLRTDPRFGTKVHHKGLDIRAKEGAVVWSPHPASVGFAGWYRGYGNLVVLDHGEGYYTLYAHLGSLDVKQGDRVERASPLGTVGATASLKGAYLYFEVRSGAKALDPMEWLAAR